MRTTIDIDTPILKELKRLQKTAGKSLGTLASELLAQALALKKNQATPTQFKWTSRAMGAKVDVADKEALNRALDEAR